MNRKPLKISLYWKCQLWGWGSLLIVFQIAFYLAAKFERSFIDILKIMIPSSISGLLFSHLMRLSFKKIKITEKPVSKQILPAILLTIFFGILHGVFGMRVVFTLDWSEHTTTENIYVVLYSFFNGIFFLMIWNLFYFLYHYVRRVKKQEQEKVAITIKTIEMEALALRAQMNPHFIFNCLNSIKSLIQNDEEQKSISYLVIFSKLIRTLFQNSNKRQISLYDELETCKLYTELERMRFDGKLKIDFLVGPNLDLKSVMIPALIIQPFIENAIWHGIVPKETGGSITIKIEGNEQNFICEVDDDGIGRESSQLNKATHSITQESKGVHLSQARLNLEKLLNESNATIQTVDKCDQNIATGTTVILTFKQFD